MFKYFASLQAHLNDKHKDLIDPRIGTPPKELNSEAQEGNYSSANDQSVGKNKTTEKQHENKQPAFELSKHTCVDDVCVLGCWTNKGSDNDVIDLTESDKSIISAVVHFTSTPKAARMAQMKNSSTTRELQPTDEIQIEAEVAAQNENVPIIDLSGNCDSMDDDSGGWSYQM